MKKRLLFLAFTFLIFNCLSFAQTLAPGAPGNDAQWATAGKQAIGTSASLDSKVWFTLADGVMTEVYYPDVTVANVHLLQFVVVNPKTKKVETETADASHSIESLETRSSKNLSPIPGSYIGSNYSSSFVFKQVNSSKTGDWSISKTYLTDPKNNSVLISVNFETKNPDLELYVYYDPSLGNTGMHDTGWTEGRYLYSADGQINSALTCGRCKISDMTNGFLGINDGLTQLKENGKIKQPFERAENGNLVQVAKITPISLGGVIGSRTNMLFALGFGKTSQEAQTNAQNTLTKGYEKTYQEYQEGWIDYLRKIPKIEAKYQAQFNMAAMVLKAQEDKTVRGANVASLTIPWGGGKNANEDVGGGYHLVWARDLYQVFTAYLALGDTAAANRALDFLFNIQQKPDGSFPQNSRLDGRNGWGGLQMDEVGFPLIMAYQLKRFDKATYENHIKKAADFIVKNGPVTPQERWEEKPGYSPSTIAAEIAGLVCAAEIARKNNDETSANLWLKTADDWQSNIEKWTATTNGKFGDGNYYVRLTKNGKPDAGEKIELSNSSGAFFENEIVDAGFLELVRLGIKSPDDPLIVKSLKVIDSQIKVNTPNGESFYRYNHDGYGEQPDGRRWNFDGTYSGTGRLWALLAGERGQYELAKCYEFLESDHKRSDSICGADGRIRLEAMANFANEGLMIPEQIWDKAETPKNIDKQFVPELQFGEGTGSATPLAWSMAQFIRLAVNLKEGRNLDTPDIVYNRYVLKQSTVSSQQSSEKDEECEKAKTFLFDDSKILQTIPQRTEKHPTIFGAKQEKETPMRFAYFGLEKEIEIVGDFTAWKPCGIKFKSINGLSNIHPLTLKFPNTARVEYKLIVDGKWITDPLNPNKVDNGVGGENSFLTMPDYKPTEYFDGSAKFIAPPLEEIKVNSKVYGERFVKVYIPYIPQRESVPLPTLYLQDGTDYVNRAKAIQIQENLVKANKIKPFIMVFVDYKDRMKEYWANDEYAKYLATEVVPAIDAKYKTIKSRDGRAVLGASLGGITSVWVGLKYSEIFSRIGGQSSSFWIDDKRVLKELKNLDANKTKYKFYFDSGTQESEDIIDSREAVEILRQKSFDVTYVEGEAGHNWTSWRDRLADAFIALWSDAKK